MLPLPRNKLAFPCGSIARPDLTHAAANGILMVVSVPACGEPAFIDLLSGATAVIPNAGFVSPTPSFIGGLGPCQFCDNSLTIVQFTSRFAGTVNSFTFGTFVQLTATTGNPQSFFQLSNNNIFCYFSSLHPVLDGHSGAQTFSNITLALNTPYFVAITADLSQTICAVTNLATGGVISQTITGLGLATGWTVPSTYFLDGFNGADWRLKGYQGAAAFTSADLSAAQMSAWANDPWSFWYPRRNVFFGKGAGASSVVFRRTLSSMGTRVGSRQAQAA